MKTKSILLTIFTLLAAATVFFTACGDDDDDDDNDSGGQSDCQTFCERAYSCGLQNRVAGNTVDECAASCAMTAPAQGYCVLAAVDCDGVIACFDSAGDDDDDDDDDDDNDNDDDTSPAGDHDPVLEALTVYLGSYDWNLVSEVAYGYRKFSDEEYVLLALEYKDEDCDLAGGKMYYSLDGGEDEVYDTLPSYVECRDSELSNLFGYDLDDIPEAREEGSHMLDVWWTDAAGNKSNKKSLTYECGDFSTSTGAVMDDFTLTDQDGNNVSLSDFPDSLIIFTSFAGWCTYCGMESNSIAQNMGDWLAAGDPVVGLGLMVEDSSGSDDVSQAELMSWYTNHNWDDYPDDLFILDDGGGDVSRPYFLSNGFPFTMILDTDHVIRVKWHGYGSGIIESIVEDILSESK